MSTSTLHLGIFYMPQICDMGPTALAGFEPANLGTKGQHATPRPPKIMWKNMVQRGRPQVTIWRMRIACWIPKYTNTHSEYVIRIAFPLQKWLHKRASMLRYMYITCLVTVIIIHETLFLFSRCHPGVFSAITRDASYRRTVKYLPITTSFTCQLNQ